MQGSCVQALVWATYNIILFELSEMGLRAGSKTGRFSRVNLCIHFTIYTSVTWSFSIQAGRVCAVFTDKPAVLHFDAVSDVARARHVQ